MNTLTRNEAVETILDRAVLKAPPGSVAAWQAPYGDVRAWSLFTPKSGGAMRKVTLEWLRGRQTCTVSVGVRVDANPQRRVAEHWHESDVKTFDNIAAAVEAFIATIEQENV